MIQICAYQGTSLISRLIRWQTRSRYSHIATRFTADKWVKLGDSEKYVHAGNVIEAWEGGVRLAGNISTSHTPGTRVDLFEFAAPLTATEEQAVARFLVRQLGKGYDYLAIVRFITREPVNRWQKSRWFCSELVFEACLTAGRNLLERCAAWEMPPRDIPRSPLLKSAGHEVTR
jgi:uncharacterized protein YycO